MDALRTYRFGGYLVRGRVLLLAYEFPALINNPASRLATIYKSFPASYLMLCNKTPRFWRRPFLSQLRQLLFVLSDARMIPGHGQARAASEREVAISASSPSSAGIRLNPVAGEEQELVWPRHNYLQRRKLASQSADEMPIL
jgi:hypothetical protein